MVDVRTIEKCLNDLKISRTLPGERADIRSQVRVPVIMFLVRSCLKRGLAPHSHSLAAPPGFSVGGILKRLILKLDHLCKLLPVRYFKVHYYYVF